MYSYSWKEVDNIADARYLSVAQQQPDGRWLRNIIFVQEKLMYMTGTYTDDILKNRNGAFTYYHANGVVETKGEYVDNNKKGIWLTYHTNGQLADSTHYANGNIVGNSVSWHQNGQIRDSMSLDENGDGTQMIWFDNGAPSAAGRLKDYKKTGKWQYFTSEGKLAAIVQYSQDNELGRYYANNNGSLEKSADTIITHKPVFTHPKSWDWSKYISKTTYFPHGFTIQNTKQAVVVVDFEISITGQVTNIFVSVPLHPAFDRVVVDAVKESNNFWKPAMMFNRPVSYKMRQSINFVDGGSEYFNNYFP